MKNRIILFLLIIFHYSSFCQTSNEKQIVMKAIHGSKNIELNDVLYFEKMDVFGTSFTGDAIKGKDYLLLVKEVWNGKTQNIDTLINSVNNERISKLKDSLSFKIMIKKKDPETIKAFFIFPNFRFSREYKADISDAYSLRAIGKDITIRSNVSFPAFAYILPYEKDGWTYYCAVDSSGKDVDDWGKEFGIKHYLIFEVKFSQ